MKIIDAHAHIGYIGGWADVGITEEELIAQMDEFNIEKTALCNEDNDLTLDVMKRHPGRIIGCVYVNPLNQKTVDDMDKYIEAGFAAVKLNPLRHAYCADAEIIDAVMEKAEKNNVPVCIHSGHPPYSLPWQVGLLAERHPNVKLMMIHMGHGHGVYIDAAIKMALRYPNIYLEMSGMPMPSKIREAYERVGAERIMFGTDTPFHHPTVEMQKVITSGLDKEAQEKIFYENAAKFFGV
ncbi:MAG: amidohydrolase family protein [Firmicutes bacterium]|nr:amidohydrolase family protein [Bacillota bacterium]